MKCVWVKESSITMTVLAQGIWGSRLYIAVGGSEKTRVWKHKLGIQAHSNLCSGRSGMGGELGVLGEMSVIEMVLQKELMETLWNYCVCVDTWLCELAKSLQQAFGCGIRSWEKEYDVNGNPFPVLCLLVMPSAMVWILLVPSETHVEPWLLKEPD